MELEHVILKEAHITIAEKMERASATCKEAHLTNQEHMEGTNATSTEAKWYVENIDK